jgi:hypothetical protein
MKLRRWFFPRTLESFIDYRKDRALLGNENQPEVPQAILMLCGCQGFARSQNPTRTLMRVNPACILFEASIAMTNALKTFREFQR